MTKRGKSGRDRDVDEIVTYERAVEVGRLLLGKLDGPMRPIFAQQYRDMPRQRLKSGRHSIRDGRRDEIERFCNSNFEELRWQELAYLYEPLYHHRSVWRLPLLEFIDRFGRPKEHVLAGAPLHSTVVLSPWGLQTEFPEMHLMKDLGVAFNSAAEIDRELGQRRATLAQAKGEEIREEIAQSHRQAAFYRRMSILSCFNLVEAYVNGLAWEYVKRHGISGLSKNNQKILRGRNDVARYCGRAGRRYAARRQSFSVAIQSDAG